MSTLINPMTAATQAFSALSNTLSPSASPATASTGSSAPAPAPFSDLLTDAVGQVDQLENQAHTQAVGLMTGSGVDVHQVMISAEKANMAFELALAVRNKAVAAYQQVIGMQF